MSSGSLINSAATRWRVPDVDGDLCVHSQIEIARCRRCLEACPKDAWVIDDDMLGIDMDACDGCGLCVPACPEGAIQADYHPAVRGFQNETIAFVACEVVVEKPADGRLSCVNAVGERELIALYRRGVTRCFVSRGHCVECPRNSAASIDSVAEVVNRVLVGRGLPAVSLVDLPASEWLAFLARTADASQPGLTRRDLLRGAGARAAESATKKWLPEDKAESTGALLPGGGQGVPALHVPRIDEGLCNGCDACVRLCPHQALRFEEGGDAYVIDAEPCTGCLICVDGCDRDAIQVLHGQASTQARVDLGTARCGGCGVTYHRPAAQGELKGYCPICTATGHHKKLFQVMD